MKEEKIFNASMVLIIAIELIIGIVLTGCDIGYNENDIYATKETKGIIIQVEKDHVKCSAKIKFIRHQRQNDYQTVRFCFDCDSVNVGDTVIVKLK